MHNTRKRKRSNSKRSNSKRSNSKRSNSKRSKHKRSKHKRSNKRSNKRSAVKNGGSYIYDMDSGEYRTVDDGQDFFRKNLSTTENNEADIVDFLTKFPDYTDNNIVKFYQVTTEYIDMEDLITQYTDPDYARTYIENDRERDKQIVAMRQAKDYLQSINIMYLDWKFDNIGRGKDANGQYIYKLFDFDASGIANQDNQWLISPIYLQSYGKDKTLPPKELDDLLFERELANAPALITYDSYY